MRKLSSLVAPSWLYARFFTNMSQTRQPRFVSRWVCALGKIMINVHEGYAHRFSALTLLYEHCTSAGLGSKLLSKEVALRELGTTGLEALLPEVANYAAHIQKILPYYIGQTSPLIMHCLYATAKRVLTTANIDHFHASLLIKETLEKLRPKWMVAGM